MVFMDDAVPVTDAKKKEKLPAGESLCDFVIVGLLEQQVFAWRKSQAFCYITQ